MDQPSPAPLVVQSDVQPAVRRAPETATATIAAAVARRPPRRREPRWRRQSENRRIYKVLGAVSIVVGLILWEVLADTGIIDKTFSSSPSAVMNELVVMWNNGKLGEALASSGQLYAVGLGITILLGIIGGVIFGWWRLLGAIFDPWIAILYSTPLIALLPLIIVWFGIGFTGRVVMVVLVAVFPLMVNVMAGTRQVDDNLLRLATSFGASQGAVLRTLVFPSLVPYIVTGLRLSVSMALIGMVIAEYFQGSAGVGGIILRAGVTLNTSGVFVGVLILAVVAITLVSTIRAVERRVSIWREA